MSLHPNLPSNNNNNNNNNNNDDDDDNHNVDDDTDSSSSSSSSEDENDDKKSSIGTNSWRKIASFWHQQFVQLQKLKNKELKDIFMNQIKIKILDYKSQKQDGDNKQDDGKEFKSKKRKMTKQEDKAEQKKKKRQNKQAVKIIKKLSSFQDIANLDIAKLDPDIPRLNQLIPIVPIAKELETLLGLKEEKEQIFEMMVNQLLFSLQKQTNGKKLKLTQGLRNMCIVGPPGVGKTTLAHQLAKLFAATGSLSKGHVTKVKADDLIGEYVGHTVPKTRKVLESALGGVLVIDEVYSLSGGSKDINGFSQKCIDTLNEFMTEHSDDLVVFVMGYEKDIETKFFAHNQGLKSRFATTLRLKGYSAEELGLIFDKMSDDMGWSYPVKEQKKIHAFIKEHVLEFKYFARDMYLLLLNVQYKASCRIWKSAQCSNTIFTLQDVKLGFQELQNQRKHESAKRKKEAESKKTAMSMYL
jgi:SpoVK/Ycf46/Vps4 family AAA+-type ATPase